MTRTKSDQTDGAGLEVRDLVVPAGSFTVGPVSLSVPRGRILALIGPSGAGKSTLLRGIAGFERPRSGTIHFDGQEIHERSPADRRVGYVFQDYALFPHLTSGGNIGFPLRIRRKTNDEVDRAVLDIVRELNIPTEHLKKYENELPEGIKQLTAIGRERAHLFDLLIMDEPMSQLDAHLRAGMRVFLRDLVRSFGTTTILALSEPEDILSLSDDIAVIADGLLVDEGPTETLYRTPNHPVTMQMLSPLGLNSLPLEHGGTERVYFRPEDTRVPPGTPKEKTISGRLERRSFMDARRELLRLDVDGRPVTIVAPIGTAPAGETRSASSPIVRFSVTRPVVF